MYVLWQARCTFSVYGVDTLFYSRFYEIYALEHCMS